MGGCRAALLAQASGSGAAPDRMGKGEPILEATAGG